MTDSFTKYANKRLLWDLKNYIKNEASYPYIKVRPLENDITEWHGNITPINTYYDGFIIHFIMKFPDDYPRSPPDITLCTGILHSNIIPNFRNKKYYLCMDLINNFFWMEDNRDDSRPFSGWSTSYTAEIIISQLYSFLFDETVENYDGRIKETIYQLPPELGGGNRDYKTIKDDIIGYEKECMEFTCSCGHCFEKPYPEVKKIDKSGRKTDIKCDIIKFVNTEDKTLLTESIIQDKMKKDDKLYQVFSNYISTKNNDSIVNLIIKLEQNNINYDKDINFYHDKNDINNNIHCQDINPDFITYIRSKLKSIQNVNKFIYNCVRQFVMIKIINITKCSNDADCVSSNYHHVESTYGNNELINKIIDKYTECICNYFNGNNSNYKHNYQLFGLWNKFLHKTFKSNEIYHYYNQIFSYTQNN